MYRIALTQESRLPRAELFARLADHENLGKVLGAPVARIREGEGDINGVNSVRRVGPALLGLEETVTGLVPGESIDYRITRGGFPLKNHRGRLEFSDSAKGSRVDWVIEFDSALPLAGPVLKAVLGTVIGKGLRGLA